MRRGAPRPAPLWQRLLWFVAIWAMSVAVLGVIGYGIRLFLL